MRLNIVIGGRAGHGINKVSSIVSKVLVKYGYFTFNYRDYQSLIRGGHSFNNLSISDTPILSHESKMDIIVALDKKTPEIHKHALKKEGIIITEEKLKSERQNLNIAMAGALLKILGMPLELLTEDIIKLFRTSREK